MSVCERGWLCLSFCTSLQHPLRTSYKLRLCWDCWHLKDSLLWDYTGSSPEAVWLSSVFASPVKGWNIILKCFLCFLSFFFLVYFLCHWFCIGSKNSNISIIIHSHYFKLCILADMAHEHRFIRQGHSQQSLSHTQLQQWIMFLLWFDFLHCQWNMLFVLEFTEAQNDHRRPEALRFLALTFPPPHLWRFPLYPRICLPAAYYS